LLAGLAAQALTTGATRTAWAFGTAAVVFAGLLVLASVGVAVVTRDALRPVRMVSPAVKRWSGFVLVAVGGWFVILAVLPSPVIGT
jgi:hypothetical protein